MSFRHTEAGGQPSKKSKKGGAEGSVALLKETIHLGCASHDAPQRKSVLRESGKLGSNHTVKFSKATTRPVKTWEKKTRNPWAPQFEERTQDETLKQEQCARKAAWNLVKDVYKLKNESQNTFYSPAEVWVMPVPSSTNPEERQFVIDSGASMHILS